MRSRTLDGFLRFSPDASFCIAPSPAALHVHSARAEKKGAGHLTLGSESDHGALNLRASAGRLAACTFYRPSFLPEQFVAFARAWRRVLLLLAAAAWFVLNRRQAAEQRRFKDR
jgi:hypothetical protein